MHLLSTRRYRWPWRYVVWSFIYICS